MMQSKKFASQADLVEKKVSFDRLSDHAYAYTAEGDPNTGVVLGDDALTALYEATHHALTAAGFEHYEISSYARPGGRAVHNARYWRGGEYLGLGVGAASFRRIGAGSERWTNARDLATWRDPDRRIADRTTQDPDELARDLLWLAMRTSDGAPLADVPAEVTAWAIAGGLADARDDRLRPTLRGFLFADQVAARLTHE